MEIWVAHEFGSDHSSWYIRFPPKVSIQMVSKIDCCTRFICFTNIYVYISCKAMYVVIPSFVQQCIYQPVVNLLVVS